MSDSSSRGTAPKRARNEGPGGCVPWEEMQALEVRVGVVVGRLRQWAEDYSDTDFIEDKWVVVARAKLLSMAAELEGLVPEQKGEQ